MIPSVILAHLPQTDGIIINILIKKDANHGELRMQKQRKYSRTI